MANEALQKADAAQVQALWAAALSKRIERSRPWTREEVHAYLQGRFAVASMKDVESSQVEALKKDLAGEPIALPQEHDEGSQT
jgi:hypothetical protein